LQAGGHRFDPGWLHVVVISANRGHAEVRFDPVAVNSWIRQGREGCAVSGVSSVHLHPYDAGFTRSLNPRRAAHQGERHLPVDEGYRGPDERRGRPVVANERGEGQLTVIDVHDDVAGQKP
jgi:hypothetical protein